MVRIQYRKRETEVAVAPTATVAELRTAVQAAVKLNIHRQAFKLVEQGKAEKEWKRMEDDRKKLSDYGVEPSSVLALKDLGPQFSYRGVFIVEYLGPILIMLAYAARPAALYGEGAAKAAFSQVQQLGIALWIAHFVKRELETLFVHKFSRATMPLSNLFKNSIYYWGFALAVGYPLCHPAYTAPASWNQVLVGAGIMVVSELVNLAVHLQLSNMRQAEGAKDRRVPEGPLFALVSCPNYTAEVLSWVGFSIMTQIGLSYVFTAVGFLQMLQWALGKHKGYKASDPTYAKRGRKAMVPFII